MHCKKNAFSDYHSILDSPEISAPRCLSRRLPENSALSGTGSTVHSQIKVSADKRHTSFLCGA
jgi:hypothetical protein